MTFKIRIRGSGENVSGERLIAADRSELRNPLQVLKSKARATLAQLVERLIRNQQVASSILAGGSILNIRSEIS
jgi:hypothetical protein